MVTTAFARELPATRLPPNSHPETGFHGQSTSALTEFRQI
jgi:hypothetical protein